MSWPGFLNCLTFLGFGFVLLLTFQSLPLASMNKIFDPLTLELSILILFLKKKKDLPLLDLNSIHLLTACFLKKKKTYYVYCIKLFG